MGSMFLDLVKGFICVGLFSVDLTLIKLCSFRSLFPYILLIYETVMQNFSLSFSYIRKYPRNTHLGLRHIFYYS